MKLKTCINEPCDAFWMNTYALQAVLVVCHSFWMFFSVLSETVVQEVV